MQLELAHLSAVYTKPAAQRDMPHFPEEKAEDMPGNLTSYTEIEPHSKLVIIVACNQLEGKDAMETKLDLEKILAEVGPQFGKEAAER